MVSRCRYRFSASCCSQGFLLHFEWGVLPELQCDDQHVNMHVFSTYKAVWWMLISTFKVLFCLKYWNGGNRSRMLKVELWNISIRYTIWFGSTTCLTLFQVDHKYWLDTVAICNLPSFLPHHWIATPDIGWHTYCYCQQVLEPKVSDTLCLG